MTFPCFHFLFLSNFFFWFSVCVVCCVLFLFLFYLSCPDLVSSCGKPDCKKNKREMLRIETGSITFCFRWRVGRESIDYFLSDKLLTRMIRSL